MKHLLSESRCFRQAGVCREQVRPDSRRLRKGRTFGRQELAEGRSFRLAGSRCLCSKKCLLKRGVCVKRVFTETGACGKQEELAESRSFRLLESRYLRMQVVADCRGVRKALAFRKPVLSASRCLQRAGTSGKQALAERTYIRKAGTCSRKAGTGRRQDLSACW